MDRETILAQDHIRHVTRAKLKSDIAQAKQDLHPKAMATRWKTEQKTKMRVATAKAQRVIRKNTTQIALTGIAALIFAARRPILRVVSDLNIKMRGSKSGTKQKE
jgi:hypothetical protein